MLLRVSVPPIRRKLLSETLVFLSLKVQEWHSLTQNLFPQQSSWRLSFNVFFLDIGIFFFARVFTTGQHKQTSRTVKTKYRYVQWLYLIALQISVEFLHSSLCISNCTAQTTYRRILLSLKGTSSFWKENSMQYFSLLWSFCICFLPLSSYESTKTWVTVFFF